MTARRERPFRLPRDLARRARLDREALLHLARAGALASLGLSRRRAVWEAMRCLDAPQRRPLLEGLIDDDQDDDGLGLPAMTQQEEVVADYRTGGLSLTAHPLAFERARLAAAGVLPIATATVAPEGRQVSVAGIALVRQRPATAKGMIFLTIEDETGVANIVVRPDVWATTDHPARRAAVLRVTGRIQRRGAVVHVVAVRLDSAFASLRDAAGSSTCEEEAPKGKPAGHQGKPAEHRIAPLTTLPCMSRDFC